MTFVRRRGVPRRIAGIQTTETLDSILPVTSALATRLDTDRHLLLYTGQRFDDSTTDGQEAGDGPGFTGRGVQWQAHPPSFLQDVLLLRPF